MANQNPKNQAPKKEEPKKETPNPKEEVKTTEAPKASEKDVEENGIAPGLHYVLYACKQLLGTQVPSSVLARLQPLEFNPSIAELFLHRRVLDTRLWLAQDLVDSRLPYSRGRALRAIIKRFFYVPEEISHKDGPLRYAIYFYFRRMKNILPRLGGALLRPKELKQELLLDRWLHDLRSST